MHGGFGREGQAGGMRRYRVSLRMLKWFTIVLPPLVIGGFELIRHELLLSYLSMETGNLYIIALTFVLSFFFATWMFRRIARMSDSLGEEQSRNAVYGERERLAQELHDTIAQNLFFLNVQLQKGDTEEARSAVAEIDHQVRQAIFNLRALPDDGISFRDRVTGWLQQWETMTGVDVSIRIEWDAQTLSSADLVHLFSIVQEAFTNIRKHSEAARAELLLAAGEAGGVGDAAGAVGWLLRIRDDGRGLQLTSAASSRYGVSMMRRRAEQLGADFTIRTLEEGGTEVLLMRRP